MYFTSGIEIEVVFRLAVNSVTYTLTAPRFLSTCRSSRYKWPGKPEIDAYNRDNGIIKIYLAFKI